MKPQEEEHALLAHRTLIVVPSCHRGPRRSGLKVVSITQGTLLGPFRSPWRETVRRA
jgi:hypothetical protein